ncbi:MAG: hypothetical protein EA409_12035 [Saprospirales bacterium]|nr:MAG: hypothetical protein EA409_12035 [Saprospirales bacterium]
MRCFHHTYVPKTIRLFQYGIEFTFQLTNSSFACLYEGSKSYDQRHLVEILKPILKGADNKNEGYDPKGCKSLMNSLKDC